MTVTVRIRLIAASFLLASSSSAFAQIDGGLPSPQQLSRFGLERAWWNQAELNKSRDKVRHVSMDEDMVYVMSTSGIVTAFDSETGKRRWAVQLGRFDQPGYPVVSNETLAMVVVGSTLYAIEKKTGNMTWTLGLPGQPSTAPGVDDDQVYVGTLEGSVYAFSLRKVRQLYQEQRLPQWSGEAIVWHASASKEITSPPIPSGRTVSFASRDGSLYSVATSDKQLIFQLETNGAIVAPMATAGKLQYIASDDNSFFAINASNGAVLWEYTAGLPIRLAPYVVENDLFLTPDRGGMYCLNATTGDQRWWQPNLRSFIAVIGNAVFASDVDGNLVRLTRDEGGMTASLALRDYSVRVANDRTDRIFMSTPSGRIVSLRQRGETIPVYHKFPDRLPILPSVEPEEAVPPAAETPDATN
ncbi:MAG: PQQ-binding-like beta-propeller repeat protein [Planctomycetes bacterium]|nr:PQQ-binding-like beta-propeller repeat protein [Planctomycetota bacterium]